MITLTLCLFVFLAVIGIIIQEFRVRDVTLSRDNFAASYVTTRQDYLAFRYRVSAEQADTVAKLRAICNGLTPSPVETMSDEVAQQLVDNFHNSSYRN